MHSNKWPYAVSLVLAMGLGVSVGLNLSGEPTYQLPAIPVDAATAQRFDNFAVATGPVDGEIEAFYFLDFLTGALSARAINTRTGEFAALYQHNVSMDFGGAAKNPKYLMVTGMANIPRGRGNTQIARSVVYITEATTGRMVAYVMPWNSSMQASGRPQAGQFLKIAQVELRSTFVRDQ
ncbi:MAG: hypothetical protein AAGJ46_05650 [Planctomycetota bacterium]